MRSPPSRRRLISLAVAAVLLVGCDSKNDPADASFVPAAAPTSANRPSPEPSNPGLSEPLVLMKFGATWCGPCRRVDRELDRLAGTVTGLEIVRVDVDERPDLARQYNVSGIPHLVLLRGGETLDTLVGYRSAADLQRWANRFGRLGPGPNPTRRPADERRRPDRGTQEKKPGEIRSNPFSHLISSPR